MSIKIEGNGVNYTFPNTFNIRGYSRSQSVPGVVIYGRHGELTDQRSKRMNPLTLTVSGRTKDNSLASAKDTYDQIINAVNSINDEVYLVNTVDDIRIPVSLVRFDHTRLPAMSMEFAIQFKAPDPFWEDRNYSEVSFPNVKMVDIPLGNAPLYPILVLKGALSNPTIVKGNWSFHSHIYTKKAQAITHGALVDPYGEITGQYSGTEDIKMSKYGFGLDITGTDTFTFGSLYQRFDKYSFNVKFRPNWNGSKTGTHYIFAHEKSGDTDHWSLYVVDGRLQFGATSTMGVGVSWATSDDIELSGWYDNEGTIIDGSTYYGKIFQDGSEIASTQAALTGCATFLNILNIGTDKNGANDIDSIVDEVYFFNQVMGDNWCEGETSSGRLLEPNNKTFKWGDSLTSSDLLEIDMKNLKITKVDESTQSTSNEIGSMEGDFFQLAEGTGVSGHKKNKMETLFFGQSMTGWVKYRKLYL